VQYVKRFWWLGAMLIVVVVAYRSLNPPPSPINASAASILVADSDLGGNWSVDASDSENSYGSTDAARGVVHPGADADVYIMVYVFRSTSDAQAGYQRAKGQIESAGWTEPKQQGAAALGHEFGQESFVGWSPVGSMVILWRDANVVASAGGVSERDADLVAVASEEADKIHRAEMP
jgi:hypothetical protein